MSRIIISLTSISQRLNVLRYTLLSLLRQDREPDLIFLNLSVEPYLIDEGIPIIPDWLQQILENEKIKLNVVPNNGPYRKLLPVFNHLKVDDRLIICDDDVIYNPNWLKLLVDASDTHDKSVVCANARNIRKNKITNRYKSYIYWNYVHGFRDSKDTLPIGVGGVLYKKEFFNEKFLFDKMAFKVAPTCDDLWFWNSLKNGVTVFVLENKSCFNPIYTEMNLTEINYTMSKSVIVLWNKFKNILGYFGQPTVKNDKVFQAIINYKNANFTRNFQ